MNSPKVAISGVTSMTGLKDSPDMGTGGRRKSREKPGSIKPQAHGSEDGGCQFKNVFLCMCFV